MCIIVEGTPKKVFKDSFKNCRDSTVLMNIAMALQPPTD